MMPLFLVFLWMTGVYSHPEGIVGRQTYVEMDNLRAWIMFDTLTPSHILIHKVIKFRLILNTTDGRESRNESFRMSLHPVPVRFDVADMCQDQYIGEPNLLWDEPVVYSHYKSGGEWITQQPTETADAMDVREQVSIRLVSDNHTICATLGSSSHHTTNSARARTREGLALDVHFVERNITGETHLDAHIDVYSLDAPLSTPHRLYIVDSTIDDTKTLPVRCSHLAPLSNNSFYFNITQQRHQYVPNIPFSLADEYEQNYIIGKVIFILNGDDVLTCAEIKSVKPMRAEAKFQEFGSEDPIEVEFVQKHPFEQTKVRIIGLENRREFTVHEFPLVVDSVSAKSLAEKCQKLESKYIKSFHSSTNEHFPVDLPLFGRETIIGRRLSMVNSSGSKFCANIENSEDRIHAYVRFLTPVQGYIFFTQSETDPWAPTSVLVALKRLDRTTTGHKFHVHQSWVNLESGNSSIECGLPARGHYNPTGVNVTNGLCSAESPLSCEIGELCMKSKGLYIPSQQEEYHLLFYTDAFLPLSGPFSILNRSVVIHDENFQKTRIACGHIVKTPTMYAKAEKWKQNSTHQISGTVTIQEFPNGITKIQTDLDGFEFARVEVRESPVPPRNGGGCEKTGEPYVQYSDPSYAIIARGSEPRERRFFVQSLSGPHNLVGRSLVVIDNQSRIVACANVTYDMERMGGHVVMATALLQSAELTGIVEMSQVTLTSGQKTPTTIHVHAHEKMPFEGAFWQEIPLNERIRGAGADSRYLWFIARPPTHLSQDAREKCADRVEVYDPHRLAELQSAEYAGCGDWDQLSCQVGDSPGKFGWLVTDHQTSVYTDMVMELSDANSVVGRSVVVSRYGTTPVACGNIMPLTDTNPVYLTFPVNQTISTDELVSFLSDLLKVHPWHLTIRYPSKLQHAANSWCYHLDVILIGPNSEPSLAALTDLVYNADTSLGPYRPERRCYQREFTVSLRGTKTAVSCTSWLLLLVMNIAWLIDF